MSDESFNWIDDQLRDVPVPEGLSDRLRRACRLGGGELTDECLDEELRAVAVPPDLLGELALVAQDEQLDKRLRDVPVPEGLLEELADIPLDEQLCDLPVPVDLLLELRRIPPRRRRRIPTMQLALAASLVLMITLGYVLSMTGLVMTAYDKLPEPYAVIAVETSPVELTSEVDSDEALAIFFPESPAPVTVAATNAIWHDPAQPEVNTHNIADTLADEFQGQYAMSQSVAPLLYGILGQPHTVDDRTPDLELLSALGQRGLEPPLIWGFDRQFLITEGTNPVVSLAQFKQVPAGSERDAALDAIRRSDLPLWTQTESFDLLRSQSITGRLPAAREIHVEDFLAAMDFQYASAPRGELAIRAAAGPSVFGEEFAQLMQVGVQAGLPSDDDQRSTHVSLAIDVSDSMRWENRLNMVRSAVREFTRVMSDEDRISLVIFNERAYVVLEDVDRLQTDTLTAALDRLSPSGGTNTLAGLQLAAHTAHSAEAIQCEKRHVVVISDGMPSLPLQTSERTAALIADLQADNIALHVVAIEGVTEPAAGLDELAALASQKAVRCASTKQLHEYLCQKLIGVSPVIARDATLTVNFNPKSVRGYRLLGHEATTAGGMLSADIESTILAGQSATGLYEVWLQPDGPSRVADVLVQWTDNKGQSRSVRQQIHRRQFKPSWREAPLSLQAATIAAEAAEVLRQSPFSSQKNRDLRDVLEQANEVNALLAERESFQHFVQVLRQAEATRRGVGLED